MLIALDIVQHEDFARAVGELLERRLEIHRDIPWARRSRERLENRLAIVEPLAPRRLGAEAFDDDIDRETVQPGAERGIPTERGELLPDADEDILGQFVDVPATR